ncbi:MAG: hypothetical protein IKA79_04285 [Lentisphaeria bacterium]|nr:hypothetical protein [Lentisphaeria bacterium]
MDFFPDTLSLPEGDYRQRKDFQFFLFVHTAGTHFAKRYLTGMPFTLLRRKLLSDSDNALLCVSEALSCTENRILFARSGDFYRELAGNHLIFLKMKKYRIFPPDSPLMHRFRSFHIRSFDLFRDWISIERYDSDLLYSNTPENMRSQTLFYPSSAELAANALFRLSKTCAGIAGRLEKGAGKTLGKM